MRVLLKHVLDTDADAAWRALQSPAVFQEVSAPWIGAASLEGGFPTRWSLGSHEMALDAFGVLPVGAQAIDLSYRRVPSEPGVRILRDNGGPLSGALRLVTSWDHRMAVSPLPDGRTLFRDQLTFDAGLMNPVVWPTLWALWQWRGSRIRSLAPGWSYDPVADATGREIVEESV
ncbi:hypothetical protein HQQ80_09670 [Microbacteriaceae bacterium VKM Ac-2855]|nr:hypothetical protein [Microbacteriaceae bacterium VKM Ac-2855]